MRAPSKAMLYQYWMVQSAESAMNPENVPEATVLSCMSSEVEGSVSRVSYPNKVMDA